MSWRRLPAAALAFLAVSSANAAGEDADGANPIGPAYSRGLVELKRQSTAHGTPEETTKGNLKFDYFPQDSVVSLLRIELPFPDENTTFIGGDPDFGDAKVRIGFRAVDASSRPVTSFVELTFPTAEPDSGGTGKYQFSAGVKTAYRLSTGRCHWVRLRKASLSRPSRCSRLEETRPATTSTSRSSSWNGETPGPKGTTSRRRPSQ